MPKVSVIIPVYNTSAYIARCCHALFSQTLNDLQFIFVDDGSTDGSIDIARSVLARYPERAGQTLFLSHPSNQGVSAARQLGLEHATGQYVIHCDSDDWVEKEAYQLLYDKAIATDADVITCGYRVDHPGVKEHLISHAISPKDDRMFSICPQTGSLCLKLVRHRLIQDHGLHFPPGINWGEDLCLSLQALLLAQSVQAVDLPLYHYEQHITSITHSVNLQRCFELVCCGEVIERFLYEHGMTDRYAFQLNWLKFQLKQYYLIFPESRNLQLWQSCYPECHTDIFRYDCALYLKLAAWLAARRYNFMATKLLQLRDFLSPLKNR